jgi:hypothetical protein
MVASQVTTWFIIIVAGTVLHAAGVTTINTAADAARALQALVKTLRRSGKASVLSRARLTASPSSTTQETQQVSHVYSVLEPYKVSGLTGFPALIRRPLP